MIDTGLKRQRGSRLREWRVGRGYLLEDLAGLSGLSIAMLSRVERGERQLKPETKIRLARAVGARVADLFEAEELAEVASS